MITNHSSDTSRRSTADLDHVAVDDGFAPPIAHPVPVHPVVGEDAVVPEHSVFHEHPVLRYLDVVAPLAAAPILLAFGAPALGYGLGAAAWIVMRVLGAAADLAAGSSDNLAQAVSLRLTDRFIRVSLLVGVTVLAFKGDRRADGVAALLVITFAYTIHLSRSIIRRPRLLQLPPDPPDLGSGT